MVGRNDICWCGSGKKYKKCHLKEDQLANRGTETQPPRNPLIKNADEINGMRDAGAFNGVLMDFIRQHIEMGISTGKINDLVHEYTLDHGHIPATLNYMKFPKSCCVSKNDTVCHGIPSYDVYLEDGDIANVDLTTIVNGWHGDQSETFLIGDVSPEAQRLVQKTGESMILAIEGMKPDIPLSTVGDIISPFIIKNGYSVVRDYTGHGIGREFHENITVLHHKNRENKKIILKAGMTFTIEPMINAGNYSVKTDKKDGWTVRSKDKSLSAQFEHTILITETGAEVLTLTPSQIASGNMINLPGVSNV